MSSKIILSDSDINFKQEIYVRGKNLVLTVRDGYISICEKGKEVCKLCLRYQDWDNSPAYLSEMIQKIVN